jgi:hypothetical protein
MDLLARGPRARRHVPAINAAADPYDALNPLFDWVRSELKGLKARDARAADAWAWAILHRLDEMLSAIGRGDVVTDPFFYRPEGHRLDPEGWRPLPDPARAHAARRPS